MPLAQRNVNDRLVLANSTTGCILLKMVIECGMTYAKYRYSQYSTMSRMEKNLESVYS